MLAFKIVAAVLLIAAAAMFLPCAIIDLTNPLCEHKAMSAIVWLSICAAATFATGSAIGPRRRRA